MKVVIDASVDKPQTVLLALLQRRDMVLATRRTLHGTVDKTGVRDRRSSGAVESPDVQRKDSIMKPVSQSQRSQVVIVVL